MTEVNITVTGVGGCSGAALLGFSEMFSTANTITGNLGGDTPVLKVTLALPEAGTLSCDGGVSLTLPKAPAAGDWLLIAGMRWADENAVVAGLSTVGEALQQLASLSTGYRRLGSHCSGSFLLAEAGLLDSGPATTAWWLAPAFERRYPAVQMQAQRMLCENGALLTAAGSTGWQDLALHIIGLELGAHVARLVAKYQLTDMGRSSQSAYAILSRTEGRDDVVLKAETWMRRHLQRDFRLEELARSLGVSQRTLIRRCRADIGDSPLGLLQRLRIEKGRMLLETTGHSLADIIVRCGYTDESAFRRQFKRYSGLSPREYRRRFNCGRRELNAGDFH